MKRKERRQPFGATLQQIEQVTDISARSTHQPHSRNRIARNGPRQLQRHKVLGQQHMSRRRPVLRLRPRHKSHAGQGVTGIDRHRSAEPRCLLLGRHLRIELCSISRRPRVLPGDPPTHGLALRVDENM